jgi:N-methylhydantoinase A
MASITSMVRAKGAEPKPPPPRLAYFGSWIDTPVMRRSDLAKPRSGPLIVEEYDATCVVPPGAKAELDTGGNIIIALG